MDVEPAGTGHVQCDHWSNGMSRDMYQTVSADSVARLTTPRELDPRPSVACVGMLVFKVFAGEM